MPHFAVILPAAGRSVRFGGNTSKLFQTLGGEPLLVHTVRAFSARNDVPQIVIASNDLQSVGQLMQTFPQPQRAKIHLCSGGENRSGSVRAGLAQVSGDIEWVAVHDAARPLISQSLIDRTLAAAVEYGAAAAALPVHLTVKQAVGPLPARVDRTVPRHNLWTMQTPQIMRRCDLVDAFAACPIPLADVTDDVQLLEFIGKPVWLVGGDHRNLKITTAIDLQIAQALLHE